MAGIALTNITKRYGSIRALSGVSLTIESGEVHALLGENGAGKSTLIRILSGLTRADGGELLVDGVAIEIASPTDAFGFGIATVYQHFTLVPNLTVAENLQLAVSATKVIGPAELDGELGALGLSLPLDARIDSLAVGQRQLVEIAKALLHRPQILLLDEPTSMLAGEEIVTLLHLLRSIADGGTAVVLVTHKLNEALAIADRLTVLRHGAKTGELNLTEVPVRQSSELMQRLITMMFGDSPIDPLAKSNSVEQTEPAEVVARILNVSARGDNGGPGLLNLSLDLFAGQIVGIAGVDGNGQRELAEVLAGERRTESGSIALGDLNLTNRGVQAAIRAGVAATTAERIAVGSVPGMNLATNLILKHLTEEPFSRGMALRRDELQSFATAMIRDYEIRPSDSDIPIEKLSGGNIQRALLARELAFSPRLLICDQPTAGLDLITTEQMQSRLRTAADAGAAVVLISSDLDELLAHADRIVVMYRGLVVGDMPRSAVDSARIGRLMVTGQDAPG